MEIAKTDYRFGDGQLSASREEMINFTVSIGAGK